MKDSVDGAMFCEDKACVFTICNKAYLAQALVAIKSFSEFNVDTKTGILLIDAVERYSINGVQIYTIADVINYTSRESIQVNWNIIDYYTVTSLCTAVKPLALMFFRSEFPSRDYYVYTDPDTLWLSKPRLQLERSKLYFFRHRDFLCTTSGYSGRNFLTFGGMNLGLIIDTGVNDEILMSWNNFAFPINIESSMLGYYTDQKPADLMVLSNRAESIYDECINLSYWNIADVRLDFDEEGYTVKQFNDQKKLVMFHFSGYREFLETYASERKNEYLNHADARLIDRLHIHYARLIEFERLNLEVLSINTNSYGTAESGMIYKYLIAESCKNQHSVNSHFLRYIIKFKVFLRFVDRIYKMKNPFKIQ